MKKIAYYGKPGSFSEEGALLCFSEKGNILVPCDKTIDEVFSKVTSGKADYGVVPVENSNAGIVNQTYDLLWEEKAFVVGEAILRIRQYLLANKGVALEDIRTVYSHPVANAQCSRFLRAHAWNIINYSDTASCASKIRSDNLMDAAAIASRRAAEFYSMNILRNDIQNAEDNFTRFFVISKEPNKKGGNKTSIVIGLHDELNRIYECLGFFIKREIKLLKLETRPSRGRPFEYIIYLDFLGSPEEDQVRSALSDLLFHAYFVRVIGNYEAASLP